ncbi:MAG: patatin-like phospholipase family protein [candidate division WOR-3 bacterium]|nr:patatin-like phospholipase family protein [candidate division WOR-3 bacterium]MCX7947043.1 patatin-like phospholipase family protein [candidate division WOR-3 bacterium]MDW8149916.1 patatin-like phospholipase family protein [candidate division WOR-3 bacterium]
MLSGGGSKGLAHIGVIKAIEEKKIELDFIVGCSMGALVGSLYGLGYSSHAMTSIARLIISKKLLNFKFSLSEFFDSKKIDSLLDEIFQETTFRELKIPVYITAVDLLNYNYIVFNDGLLKNAIRASISLPVIFKPVMINGRVLIDGGIIEILPLSVARKLGANYIIAVNVVGSLSEDIYFEDSSNVKSIDYGLIRTALSSIYILQRSQIQKTIESFKPEVLINVDTSGISPIDFNLNLEDIISRGYESAKNALK